MANDSEKEPRARPEDFPTELLEQLEFWHGGQASDAYSVLSMGGDVPVSTVEGAASELGRALRRAKTTKYKGYTRDEINAVKSAIDLLNYIANSRRAGHEPV